MGVTLRVFPKAFKREAIDRAATSGLAAGAMAQELGLHETALRRWMVTFRPAKLHADKACDFRRCRRTCAAGA